MVAVWMCSGWPPYDTSFFHWTLSPYWITDILNIIIAKLWLCMWLQLHTFPLVIAPIQSKFLDFINHKIKTYSMFSRKVEFFNTEQKWELVGKRQVSKVYNLKYTSVSHLHWQLRAQEILPCHGMTNMKCHET